MMTHVPRYLRSPNLGFPCQNTLSVADFFQDCPWLDIPHNRRALILVESLRPHMGLLGGNPEENGKPKSKLAALAAARRKKENVGASTSTTGGSSNSVALLDRLSNKSASATSGQKPSLALRDNTTQKISSGTAGVAPGLPSRPKEPKEKEELSSRSESIASKPAVDKKQNDLPLKPPTGLPSVFAQAIFASSLSSAMADTKSLSPFTSFVYSTQAKSNPFTGPSPDDVVIRAQAAKGSKH